MTLWSSRKAIRRAPGALVMVLLGLATCSGLVSTSAQAADPSGVLVVRIGRVSAAVLKPTDGVTVTGTVRNPERYRWTDVRVTPSVTRTPFANRHAARLAVSGGIADLGQRIVTDDAVGRLGTLRPGQSRRFTLTLTAADLQLSGTTGVYALAIKAVATAPNGVRPSEPIGRAGVFLPMVNASAGRPATRTPTTVLWPFLLPGRRTATDGYADGAELAASIAPNGQLRNLLNLVRTTPRRGSDVVIDPSLLQSVLSLAQAPGHTDAIRVQRRNANTFVADLTQLADRYSCSSIGYDRPDLLAIDSSPAAKELLSLVDQATTESLDRRDLSCMRIEWPSDRGIDQHNLTVMRRRDIRAVIISPWAAPGWDGTRGNLLERRTSSGDLPLVVNDRLDDGMPGLASVATLRQSILSDALFTSLSAGADAGKVSTVVMVDPTFDPGITGGRPLAAVFANPVTDPQNFKASVESRRTPYDGPVPEAPGVKTLSARQLAVVGDAAHTAQLLDGMLLEKDARTGHAQLVASLLSQRWRHHGVTGLKAAQFVYSNLNRELAEISVDGPPALTLSSRAGQFGLTIGNDTPHRVRVGLGLDSSAPHVTFKAPATVDVAAGESRTVNVEMNMNSQSATTVTAHLSGARGDEFGAATDFNVRSSRVGAALWVAIGLSVSFVVIALIRRFARPGHRPAHPTLPPDDFDD